MYFIVSQFIYGARRKCRRRKQEGRKEWERETEREKKKKIPVWSKKWKGERKEVQKKKLLFSSLSAPATLTNQSQIMSSTSLGWIVIAKKQKNHRAIARSNIVWPLALLRCTLGAPYTSSHVSPFEITCWTLARH